MAFTPDMPASARRHLEAGDKLNDGDRRDVAGYLYGISAECALKAMMLEAGMRPKGERRNDPFYLHFPQLRTVLLDSLQGRRAGPLSNFVADHGFFSNWAVEMRYAKGAKVLKKWVDTWALQATQVVGSIGT
ncbi:hypothetical protein ACGLHS_23805 [Variovorax sp. VaC1]|uniref:hypothetical protein n=1 Tax=Variovorax sp. VaC1 TaxID=3373132 RepID=UPI003747B2E5